MISLVVASSVRGFSESTAGLRVVNLTAFFLYGVFDISREITRVAGNTRGTWYYDKEQNSRCRHRGYSWCYGGQCLDVTHDRESYTWYHLVIIASTKCPHLHPLLWRYRQAFWYEVGEVSRKCCSMHQRKDRRRKTTTQQRATLGNLPLSSEISQHGESVILVQHICVFDQA